MSNQSTAKGIMSNMRINEIVKAKAKEIMTAMTLVDAVSATFKKNLEDGVVSEEEADYLLGEIAYLEVTSSMLGRLVNASFPDDAYDDLNAMWKGAGRDFAILAGVDPDELANAS